MITTMIQKFSSGFAGSFIKQNTQDLFGILMPQTLSLTSGIVNICYAFIDLIDTVIQPIATVCLILSALLMLLPKQRDKGKEWATYCAVALGIVTAAESVMTWLSSNLVF